MSERRERITPMMMVSSAKDWNKLYEEALNKEKHIGLLPGLYCLFTALEFYLKALIILRDKNYTESRKLINLGHNFKKMIEIIESFEDEPLLPEIRQAIEKYNLSGINITDIKYPVTPRMWHISPDLERGNHSLTSIFSAIETEVRSKGMRWLQDS